MSKFCNRVITVHYVIFPDNVTVEIPDNFLPFGPMYGDAAIIPPVDDGSSEEIRLGTDIVIFGARNNRLYVSLNSD